MAKSIALLLAIAAFASATLAVQTTTTRDEVNGQFQPNNNQNNYFNGMTPSFGPNLHPIPPMRGPGGPHGPHDQHGPNRPPHRPPHGPPHRPSFGLPHFPYDLSPANNNSGGLNNESVQGLQNSITNLTEVINRLITTLNGNNNIVPTTTTLNPFDLISTKEPLLTTTVSPMTTQTTTPMITATEPTMKPTMEPTTNVYKFKRS